jgi:hypothetical protein
MKFWNVGRATALVAADENGPLLPAATAALVMAQCGEGILVADMRVRGQPIVRCCQSKANSSLHDAARALTLQLSSQGSATRPVRPSGVP